MIVERLTPGDLTSCAQISQASFSAQTFDLEEELRREIARIWVARATEGSPAAAFLLAWSVADELHVLTVATRPEERRRGFARALVRAALEYARSTKTTLVLLEVKRDNQGALALYRAEGFAVVHLRRGYYSDGTDAVDMSLRLDPETGAVVPQSDEPLE